MWAQLPELITPGSTLSWEDWEKQVFSTGDWLALQEPESSRKCTEHGGGAVRERTPISCQGDFINRELPARWGPGPSTAFQDVSPPLGGPPGPCTAFGLLWAQSRARSP